MYEYFTIMLKENDTSNMKLLTEKLNAGFSIGQYIAAGKSTVVTMQKYTRTGTESNDLAEGVSYGSPILSSTRF